jgi:hypothetical protein
MSQRTSACRLASMSGLMVPPFGQELERDRTDQGETLGVEYLALASICTHMRPASVPHSTIAMLASLVVWPRVRINEYGACRQLSRRGSGVVMVTGFDDERVLAAWSC